MKEYIVEVKKSYLVKADNKVQASELYMVDKTVGQRNQILKEINIINKEKWDK